MNTPVNSSFFYIKVGCKGCTLHGHVSMMHASTTEVSLRNYISQALLHNYATYCHAVALIINGYRSAREKAVLFLICGQQRRSSA